MTKWPRYGHCKTRLSKDVGKKNALLIQIMMLQHTISVAKSLFEKNILDISLAISGIGFNSSKRWCQQLGLKDFYLQGKGSLGERMRRQILKHQKHSFLNKDRPLIFIGTDLPNLCHLELIETISRLKSSEVVIGPSSDGGYWLIAFSATILSNNLFHPFIDIKWSTSNVLQKTIDNLNKINLKVDYLNNKIDVDNIHDLVKVSNGE
mgnify:FL=1|tara:strand:+ start:462 stop:1082 length:621 start_codon:yes stop_codon:yes gene_type:complete